MDQKYLQTSWKQRIIIIVIAVLLLGSTIFAYMFIVLNNGSSSTSNNEALITKLTEEYDTKTAELNTAAKPLSDKYFPEFSKYRSEVKAYNAANANAVGVETKDLKVGTGKTLGEGNTDYFAYYLGWCADGSIFDSSFNNNDDPTSLKAPLDPSTGLIEGWGQGVVGMKLGGIRQLTISSDLAYGDTRDDICGGTNSPLKFIILAIDRDEKIAQINSELNAIYEQLYYAYYGSNI